MRSSRKIEKVDGEEDERFGKGQRGDDLPAALATVEGRRAKIREAKQALEEEARQRARAITSSIPIRAS